MVTHESIGDLRTPMVTITKVWRCLERGEAPFWHSAATRQVVEKEGFFPLFFFHFPASIFPSVLSGKRSCGRRLGIFTKMREGDGSGGGEKGKKELILDLSRMAGQTMSHR